ncbi:MAG: LamG domain-containing protein [Bacteroidetes bacterium]|nr:LamG domain-containing protein [Bacteroidota bacterium]
MSTIGFVLDSADCNDNNPFIGNTVYVNAGADQMICEGGLAMLFADGNVDNYLWSNGETNSFIFVSPATTTTYVLNGSTSGGCTATDTVIITVNQQPNITFTANSDSSSCSSINDGGITISNVVGGSSQNGYQYIIFGNDYYDQNTTGVFNNLFSGEYTINIIDDSGCEGANPMSVIVESPAPLVLHVTPPVLGLCQGTTGYVTLSVTGGAGLGYSISGDTTAGLTVGTYYYTVSEPGGCSSTTELQVVEILPPSPVITASGSLQICDGESVQLSVLADSNFALQFDGIDDYLHGDNSDLPYGSSSRTVEAWINPSNVSDGTIFSYGDTVGNFTLGLKNGKLYGHSVSDVDGFIETHESFGTTTLVPGTWYHVAFEYFNFQYRLYLNSALESESFAYNYVMGDKYKIGANINGAHFYSGLIDELRVWNYDVVPSELFLNSQSFTNNGSFGLIEYFNFNEGADTIAFNSSTFTPGQGAAIANPVGGIMVNNQEAAILKNGVVWSNNSAPIDSIVSYLWTPNNETNDSITASAAGTYTVLATYNSGCTASTSIEVTTVSCISPYYPPPANGKVDDKSDLSFLNYILIKVV